MSDHELLELAAKAAGMEVRAFTNGLLCFWHQRGPADAVTWNPLTDDGDALRLAVKLQIDIKQYVNHAVAWFGGGYIGTGRVFYNGDPCAATRRVIVLAAAEIGRDEALQPAAFLPIPSQGT